MHGNGYAYALPADLKCDAITGIQVIALGECARTGRDGDLQQLQCIVACRTAICAALDSDGGAPVQ